MIFYTLVRACVSFGCVSFSIYMGSLNHSHVHTAYSFNPIPLLGSPTTGTPSPFLPPQLTRLLLPRTMPTAKFATACLKKIKCSFVTYATQDGMWTASSHPQPPSQWEMLPTPHPRLPYDTSAFHHPSSILTLLGLNPACPPPAQKRGGGGQGVDLSLYGGAKI